MVGNLPFNVSIPLILKLCRMASKKEQLYQFGRIPLYFVFQKEIAYVCFMFLLLYLNLEFGPTQSTLQTLYDYKYLLSHWKISGNSSI